jgi:hypothetical protein
MYLDTDTHLRGNKYIYFYEIFVENVLKKMNGGRERLTRAVVKL